MAQLIHKKKTILKDMVYSENIFRISVGLMFASKKRIKKGMCLTIPSSDRKYGSSVTMLFCFNSMHILFVNSKMKVVDKTTLKPWRVSYTPKEKAKYVVESLPNTFKNIKIGDKIEIKNN